MKLRNLKEFMFKVFKYLTTIIVCFKTAYSHTQGERIYILGVGDKDASRLDFQSGLFNEQLTSTLKEARTLKKLEGSIVVDFGCGVSSAYPTMKKFIGEFGQYVGIDSSQEQIDIASCKKYPNASYICGDNQSSESVQAISSADIVFMRFVVMHQKNQEDFIRIIYSYMKPGAMLIIQEPEGTPERRAYMEKKYPGTGILCDFKPKLGRGLGLDYNFARNLKSILEKFEYKQFSHKTETLYVRVQHFKLLYGQMLESTAEKAVSHGICTKDEIEQLRRTLSEIPDDDELLPADALHTCILVK